MPNAVLSSPDARPARARSPRPVNLFKRIFGKQYSLPVLSMYKNRPEKVWKGYHARRATGYEDGDSNSELKTPASPHRLHWDYAKTVYRGSVELSPSISSTEDFAPYGMLSPTDKVPPVDHWSTPRSITGPQSEEVASAKELSSLGSATRPPSPSEYSFDSSSSTGESENNIPQAICSRNGEAEPSRPVRPFTPPTPERETRRASLMLRPLSLVGPAPQGLSPPPVKVCFPAHAGAAAPGRTPPIPAPRRRPRRSMRRSQLLRESAQNAPRPASPASLTPDEARIQPHVQTQQADSTATAPLGYSRSFKQVGGPTYRALPTPPTPLTPPTPPVPPVPSVRPIRPLPPLPITAPLSPPLDDVDGADTVAERLPSPPSEASGLLWSPPALVPDITTARSQKEISPLTNDSWSSTHATDDNCASAFLNLSRSALSPRSPELINAMHRR